MAAPHKRTAPISLLRAAWQFAPPNIRKEAKSERSKPRSPLPRGKLGGPQGDAIISVLETIGDFVAAAVDPYDPTPAMKKHLLRQLQAGKFHAFGIRTKPEIGHGPEVIPVHMFKGRPQINWRLETMENLGLRFEIIEVARMPMTRIEPASNSRVKRGRHRVDLEISTVISQLKKTKSFDGLIEKQRVALIQSRCRAHYPARFPTPTQPSLTKIRDVLRREGF